MVNREYLKDETALVQALESYFKTKLTPFEIAIATRSYTGAVIDMAQGLNGDLFNVIVEGMAFTANQPIPEFKAPTTAIELKTLREVNSSLKKSGRI
jgi:hypothetical protein